MKIINVENGKEKVYIQLKDIDYLNGNGYLSTSICNELLSNELFTTCKDRRKFISFNELEEIEYFKNLYFIFDYNDFLKLTPKKYQIKRQELLNKYIPVPKEAKHISLYKWNQIIQNLDYMNKCIQEFYCLKKEQKIISFSQVPNSIGFKLKINETYEIISGLDSNMFYIYRTDNQPFKENIKISNRIYKNALEFLIIENENCLISDYVISNSLSEDKTKIIIKFEFKNSIKQKEKIKL